MFFELIKYQKSIYEAVQKLVTFELKISYCHKKKNCKIVVLFFGKLHFCYNNLNGVTILKISIEALA